MTLAMTAVAVKVIIVPMTLIVVAMMMIINICLSVAMPHDCRLFPCNLKVLKCVHYSAQRVKQRHNFNYVQVPTVEQRLCTSLMRMLKAKISAETLP